MSHSTIFALMFFLVAAPPILLADQPVDVDLSSGAHPAIGSADRPITVIEFSDFECPNCRRLEPTLIQLRHEYEGRARFVWMDFPLQSHRHAMLSAIAARCANEQDKFWPYHDALMSGREALGEANLKDLADRLGLQPDTFSACLMQRKYQGIVESDMDAGDAIGISGTPSLIINGRLYTGALSLAELRAALDAAAASSPAAGAALH